MKNPTLLLSIATAFLLGEWLGRYSYGFFIVTIAFALVSHTGNDSR